MARTLIRNKWNECQTLPAPFNTVLGPLGAIMVPKSETATLALLLPIYGSIAEIASRLEIRAAAASEAPWGPTGSARTIIFVGARAQANVNLASPGSTFDTSVTATDGMLILCDEQTTAAQDGIYIWLGATTPMIRAGDLPAGSRASGLLVAVEAGTSDGDKLFLCTTNFGSDVVGTNGLVFSAIGSALNMTESNLRTAAAALTASLAVNSQKITGLAAGTTAGDAVRYEQTVRTSGNQTGASGIAGDKDWSGAQTYTGGVAVTTTPSYPLRDTVANIALLAGVAAGAMAYATDGVKVGELPAGGTGTLAYYDGTAWRRVGDDTTLTD